MKSYLIIVLLLLSACTVHDYGIDTTALFPEPKTEQQSTQTIPRPPPINLSKDALPSFHDPENIRIASWNIQTFGKTKAENDSILAIISQTIVQYDIVAIQEIRDESGTAIQKLESELDLMGKDYGIDFDYIISPRIGRTNIKEQYAFMYRTDRIKPVQSYTYEDSLDIFHREPFIAQFNTIPEPNSTTRNFSFVIVQIHTDPDNATEEINALPSVVIDAQQFFKAEQDFIIAGDLNADCRRGTGYFDENDYTSPMRTAQYVWLISNDMDTNVAPSLCTYDRIIVTQETMEDYGSLSGVDLFDIKFNLTPDQAKKISDHYPVWAVFNTENDMD